MSWWTDGRDALEGIATGGIAGFFNDSLGNKQGAIFNKVTGRENADDARNRQYAINDQIKAYKEQTDLAREETNKARDAQTAEKRRINEKQIRSIRNGYRSSGGFMGNQAGGLGNDNQQPNKLGT